MTAKSHRDTSANRADEEKRTLIKVIPDALHRRCWVPKNPTARLYTCNNLPPQDQPRHSYNLGFLATIKYIGVNSFSRPPATKQSAASARLVAVL